MAINTFDAQLLELERTRVTRLGDKPRKIGDKGLFLFTSAFEYFLDTKAADTASSAGAIFLVTSSKRGRRRLVDEQGKDLRVREGKAFIKTIDGEEVTVDAQRLMSMAKEPLKSEIIAEY